MTAEALSRKIKRAFRNQTGVTFSADQVCELIQFGILDTLTEITNEETKQSARLRLDQFAKERSGRPNEREAITQEAIEAMCRNV